MLLWFLLLSLLGIGGIARAPGVLAAANPLYALDFCSTPGLRVSLRGPRRGLPGVTGGEAMYADMGHFGRLPIRLGWFALVLPGLALNYFGQGALLIADPSALRTPSTCSRPTGLHYPWLRFATAAAIIASQAIISGAFSLTQQAIQLGFLPRMRSCTRPATSAGRSTCRW